MVIDAVIADETDADKLTALCTHPKQKATKEEIKMQSTDVSPNITSS